jgi:hypothetical protein
MMFHAPKIDDRTLRDIEAHLSYCETATDLCSELFQLWWHRKRKVASYADRGRDYWYEKWIDAVAEVRSAMTSRKNGRCVECGAKLKTSRCLACDLIKKMKRKDHI